MKRISILCTSAVLALALAGCDGLGGGTADHAEFIGLDAAKAAALQAAGVQESAAEFSTTGLDQRNGIDFYAVDFTANGQSYEYDIDAITGVVIDSSTSDPSGAQSLNNTEEPAPSTSQTVTGPVADPLPVISQDGTAQTSPQQATTGITADEAKQAALTHAGLSSGDVTIVKCELDWDDGRQVYEVEFYDVSYKEYDYEIDASTGEIVKYDYDAEYSIPQTSGTQSITADEAKALALAQVPGATTSDIYQFEVDYDDGRIRYEGEILYNGMKYEFEIDGYSGSIREWESEPFGR